MPSCFFVAVLQLDEQLEGMTGFNANALQLGIEEMMKDALQQSKGMILCIFSCARVCLHFRACMCVFIHTYARTHARTRTSTLFLTHARTQHIFTLVSDVCVQVKDSLILSRL